MKLIVRSSLRAGITLGALAWFIALAPAQVTAQVAAPAGQGQSGTAVAQPIAADTMPLGTPTLSVSQRATLLAVQNQSPRPGPPLARTGSPVGPPAGTETRGGGSLVEPQAPGSLILFQGNNPTSVIPAGFKSNINEPSVAGAGRVRFQTGNWFTAFTNNFGLTYTHLSPFTAFPASDGGFCCDQVTIYDPGRDQVLWLLQYIKSNSTSTGTNRIRIAAFRGTRGGITPSGWIYYDFAPTNVGGSGGEWFDYPHLALTNDFLYVAINVYRTTDNGWTRTVLFRLPLDSIRAGAGFGYNYVSWTANFNFTPVQGAKDVIYWASHNSTSSLRIFRWAEDSGTYFWFDRAITAWSSTGRGSSSCPTADGQNWCLRTDHRILAGALSWNHLAKQAELWWFWNVKQGAGFAWPYIEAAKFRESDLAYLSRPLIWNSTLPFHYVAAAPNERGDVGLSIGWGPSSTRYPSTALCADDDYNGDPPGWECIFPRFGTNGPSNNGWGDYFAVRPFGLGGLAWHATSFTQQGGKLGSNVETRNYIFGRERDRWQWVRVYDK